MERLHGKGKQKWSALDEQPGMAQTIARATDQIMFKLLPNVPVASLPTPESLRSLFAWVSFARAFSAARASSAFLAA